MLVFASTPPCLPIVVAPSAQEAEQDDTAVTAAKGKVRVTPVIGTPLESSGDVEQSAVNENSLDATGDKDVITWLGGWTTCSNLELLLGR